MKKSWPVIGLMLIALIVITFIQIWVVHWAVGLFYPITMTQALGIIILIDILSIPFKRK